MALKCFFVEVRVGLLLQLVSHRVDLEAVKASDELGSRPFRAILWVNHKQHVWKSGAEIGAICVVVSARLRIVDFLAFWAVELHHCFSWHIREADRQHLVVLAINSWAVSEVALVVLFHHLCNSSICQNISRVNEPVEHLRRLLNQIVLVRVVIQVVIRLQIQNHIQRLSVMWNLLVKPGEVEFILDVVLVDLAKELVASQTTEPRNP